MRERKKKVQTGGGGGYLSSCEGEDSANGTNNNTGKGEHFNLNEKIQHYCACRITHNNIINSVQAGKKCIRRRTGTQNKDEKEEEIEEESNQKMVKQSKSNQTKKKQLILHKTII